MELKRRLAYSVGAMLVIGALLLWPGSPFAQTPPSTDVQQLAGAVGLLAGEVGQLIQMESERSEAAKAEVISRQELKATIDELTREMQRRPR